MEGNFHWGYWIRAPETSKVQPSLPIPPPTTLIGALSMPLVRTGALKTENSDYIGEAIIQKERNKTKTASSSALLQDVIIGAAASLSDAAMYWEDINKYTTLHFHPLTKWEDKEEAAGGRRYLEEYRSGAITTGKVYYPNGGLTIVYLIDEDRLEKKIHPRNRIVDAAWTMTRIGGKESLFSVKRVEVFRPESVDGQVSTRFYFPIDSVKDLEQFLMSEGHKVYRESFWRDGWTQDGAPQYIEYFVPGHRTPIDSTSVSVDVDTQRHSAYRLGPQGEDILIV